MKKFIYSLFALAIAAMTFTSCEDVPMPYGEPTNNGDDSKKEIIADPTGKGTVDDPYNISAAIEKIKATGTDVNTDPMYVKGIIVSISSVETKNYGNANYYIADSKDATQKLYIFQSHYLGNVNFTSQDQIKVGDEVVIYGPFVNFKGNTQETVGKGSSYIYSLNGKKGTDTTSGDGTATSPYNVAGILAKAATMSETDKLENIYVSGTISSITKFDANRGQISYNITDDGTKNTFYIYGGLNLNGEKFTSKDQIKVGQKATIAGTLLNYKGNTPELQYGNKLISLTGDGKPSTPDDGQTTAASFGLADKTVFGTQTMTDGTKIITEKGTNSSIVPTFYSAGSGNIRLYPGNTITIDAGSKKIASISITCDSYNGTNCTADGTITISAGTSKLSDLIYTISDINNSVITITNAYNGSGTKSQLRIISFKITYAK